MEMERCEASLKQDCAKKVQHHLLEATLAFNGYNYLTDNQDASFVAAALIIKKLMDCIDGNMGWSMAEICRFADEQARAKTAQVRAE